MHGMGEAPLEGHTDMSRKSLHPADSSPLQVVFNPVTWLLVIALIALSIIVGIIFS